MVNLDDVSVFIAVVEAQNFSAAARELKISPSAVSKRINRLEHQLRAKLINRSSRRISLSAAGSAFFEKCAGIRPIVDQATRAVQSLQSVPGGKLRVHASTGLGIKLITPLVALFMDEYADLSVDLITHVHGPTVIAQGADIILHQEEVLDKTLDHRDLGVIHYAICASPAYLRRVGRPETPRDLSKHNCMVYAYETGQLIDRWEFKGKAGPYGITVTGNFVSNNSAALHEAAVKGVGIALLPVYAGFDDVSSRRLDVLFSNEVSFSKILRAYYPRGPHQPVNVRLFLDFITIHVKDYKFSV
ncbi:MAG TPA: LysR family transcriptional regulator [Stellaceae bacterium]|jgi:DNA-binding transcriptional LysR family regulator|nr:LysR family transcriptional regulator [Stellaceae bacterium]